jgi:hypothetical protein
VFWTRLIKKPKSISIFFLNGQTHNLTRKPASPLTRITPWPPRQPPTGPPPPQSPAAPRLCPPLRVDRAVTPAYPRPGLHHLPLRARAIAHHSQHPSHPAQTSGILASSILTGVPSHACHLPHPTRPSAPPCKLLRRCPPHQRIFPSGEPPSPIPCLPLYRSPPMAHLIHRRSLCVGPRELRGTGTALGAIGASPPSPEPLCAVPPHRRSSPLGEPLAPIPCVRRTHNIPPFMQVFQSHR